MSRVIVPAPDGYAVTEATSPMVGSTVPAPPPTTSTSPGPGPAAIVTVPLPPACTGWPVESSVPVTTAEKETVPDAMATQVQVKSWVAPGPSTTGPAGDGPEGEVT